MTNFIGRIDELTKEERRALRTRARMQRKLANGRCKNHGGASTGARTPEGKAKSLSKLKQFQNKATN